MTDQQREALTRLCERYNVEFDESHYLPAFDLPPGYVAGWVGGPNHAGRWDEYGNRVPGGTIYVGCCPSGRIHS